MPPTPGPYGRLVFDKLAQRVSAGDTFPTFFVNVEDTSGALITSADDILTLSLENDPGHGALHGTRQATAVHGVATFSGLSIDSAGPGYRIRVSAPPRVTGISDSIEIAPRGSP